MDKSPTDGQEPEPIARLRRSLQDGNDWFTSLLEAMALWTVPEETRQGRRYNYFIGGEAFDWLLLAERLYEEMDGVITSEPMEELLLSGRLPEAAGDDLLRDRLGVDKYRGYLNYFYGVTIEEALQLATEREVHKRHLGKGNRYQHDFSKEAFESIYRAPREQLLQRFQAEMGYESGGPISLTESKEFTYWLFKHRLHISDGAKAASDTQKGLRQFQQMAAAPRTGSRQ